MFFRSKAVKPGPSAYQTTYALLCEAMRRLLRDVVEAGCGGRIGSVEYRASGALYALLAAHSVDRRGRCRACRRRGIVVGRGNRRCRVYVEANYWLHYPEMMLLRQLASELNHRPGGALVDRGGQP